MSRRPLDHDELVGLLNELADELDRAATKPVDVRIVGGAAVSAVYNAERDVTDDVDCLESSDASAVAAAAVAVARRHDLDDDWVNFKVRMYAPDPMYPPPEWVVFLERSNVRLLVANPRLLLAMKIKANRPNRDFADIEVLLGACRITTYVDALACFEEHYTTEAVAPRAEAYLRAKLDPT